jgi:Carboxypeptidase regulatory-like domain
MKHLFTSLLMLCVVGATSLFAQVTNGTMVGLVMDNEGEALIGATVVATHVPSGTVYGTATRTDGRYTIPNMRVGGPYSVRVTYTGFKTSEATVNSVALGTKTVRDFIMENNAVAINGVEVVADASLKTGAASGVNSDQIRALPTIRRSIDDYTRLNPLAAEGGSFGGRNDQFNNYSLDGAIFNNPFGLDAATPGGQTDAQPVSLDAIEQINVSIAPYDVTQAGFTGAAINAVTKSGTNQFHGTVYGFGRNKNMYGVKVGDDKAARGDLRQTQTGFSVGGPLIKNKLFFFANVEVERRSDLGSYFVPNRGTGASNESRVLASDMELVRSLLKSKYGYESGEIENFRHRSDNQKALLKLDWNINESHSLSIMGNFMDAAKDKPAHPSAIGRRGPDFLTLQMQNAGYRINNKLFGGIAELKSLFGNRASNKLQVGRTAFRDSRDPFSDPFPVLNIHKDGTRYIIAGHEPFSVNNVLDQDVFQVTDNLNLYFGKHTVTVGGSFERFNFNNSFNLTAYGDRVFNPVGVSIDTFAQWINSGAFDGEVATAKAAYAENNANNKWSLAETNLGQLAFYGQDEFAVNNKLTLTLGLRADMPLYFDTAEKIQENIDRKGGKLFVDPNGTYAPDTEYYDTDGNPVKFDHTVLPKQTPLFSPRFGFNFDVQGNGKTQLRGGTGLFTGRFPFVWIGNQVANPDFFFYCMTDPNFKFPQVLRTNFGVDHKFGKGFAGSLDIIHTKDINAVMVKNYGLRRPTGTLEGVGARPVYLPSDRAQVFGPTNAYVVTNTSLGYSLNVSPQLTYTNGNGSYMVGYNFLDAKDAASIDAEISSDAYDRNPANVVNTNQGILQPSLYGNRHRLIGSATYRFKYGRFGTTVSVFGEAARGGRYSYTYSGDINGDGSGLNDLIFIPTDAQIDQMTFSGDATSAGAQRAAFKSYIAQDDYLSENRGEFAEKYASLSPWFSRLDMRILQDIKIAGSQNVQLSIDILNFGNLINSNLGVRQFASQTGLLQPVAVGFDANNAPVYTFDPSQKSTFFNDFSLASRWQLQLGLRYSF